MQSQHARGPGRMTANSMPAKRVLKAPVWGGAEDCAYKCPAIYYITQHQCTLGPASEMGQCRRLELPIKYYGC